MATPERFAADFLTAAETGWKDVHSPEYDADPRSARIAHALRAAGVEQAFVLGAGSFGVAAAMQDGRVVKLTTDETEVAAGSVLKDRNLAHVAHVYGAWFVRGVHADRWDLGTKGRVGMLITERVSPLDYRVDADGAGFGQGAEVTRVWKEVRRQFGASPESLAEMTHAESRKILRLASKTLEARLRDLADEQRDPIARAVADALRELRAHRVYSIDVHAGNIGYSHHDGVFKVFDIGSSSSPEGHKPPELPHASGMPRGGMVEEGTSVEEIGDQDDAPLAWTTADLRPGVDYMPEMDRNGHELQPGDVVDLETSEGRLRGRVVVSDEPHDIEVPNGPRMLMVDMGSAGWWRANSATWAGEATNGGAEDRGRRKKLRVDKLIVGREAMAQALWDVGAGRVSRTKAPLDVWYKPDCAGQPVDGYLLTDGHHRLVELLMRGPAESFTWSEVEVRQVGSGYNDYWRTPAPEERFVFTETRYGGLEALADEDILATDTAKLVARDPVGAAEDVIKLDRDAVYRGAERVVEAYARVLKRVPFDKGAEAVRTWFKVEASMVEGEPTVEGASMTPFYDYPGDLKDVRGNEIEVRVMRLLVLREQNYGLIIDAFTQAVKRGRAANIWIRINLGSPEIEKLRDQPELFVPRFASIFLHELTHVRDVIKMVDVFQPKDDRVAYYNSPHERRAYTRQIVEEVVIQARFNRDVRRAPNNEALIETALANSHYWLQVEPYLTEENKRLVLQAVYRNLERENLLKRHGSMRLPRTRRSRAAEDFESRADVCDDARVWYHGSPNRFDAFQARVGAPFGGDPMAVPIFLTCELATARAHAGPNGFVYTVKPTPKQVFRGQDLFLAEWPKWWPPQHDEMSSIGARLYEDLEAGRVFDDVHGEEADDALRAIARGHYDIMETGQMKQWLLDHGYDAFVVREAPRAPVSLAVMDPGRLKIVGVKHVDEMSRHAGVAEDAHPVPKKTGVTEQDGTWYHVTHISKMDSIREHGLQPSPTKSKRTYRDDLESIGGVYVTSWRKLNKVVDMMAAQYPKRELVLLTLSVPAGARFCLDEDEVTAIRYGVADDQPGLSRRILDQVRGLPGEKGEPGDEFLLPRWRLNVWSCKLAAAIDQKYLDWWNLRLFSAPTITQERTISDYERGGAEEARETPGRRKRVALDRLIFGQEQARVTLKNIAEGRVSHSSGPLDVWYVPELRKYILADGFHRLVEMLLLSGPPSEIPVRQIGSGEHSYYKVVPDPIEWTHTRFGSLEAVADLDTLEATQRKLRTSYAGESPRSEAESTPLPFALVRHGHDVVPTLLVDNDAGEMVGVDVQGRLLSFGTEDVVGLVNAEPAAVWYGVRVEAQQEALPMAAEAKRVRHRPAPYVPEGQVVDLPIDDIEIVSQADYDNAWRQLHLGDPTSNAPGEEIDWPRVRKYLRLLDKEPVRVVGHGAQYALDDGHHRYIAAKLSGRTTIPAEIADEAKYGAAFEAGHTLSPTDVAALPIGSLLWWNGQALIVVPGGLAPVSVLPERAADYRAPDGESPESFGGPFTMIATGSGKLPVQDTAQRKVMAWWDAGGAREEAGQKGVKKGDVLHTYPGLKVIKGGAFKVKPRGQRFQWTPEKPRGLTAFPEVKKVLLKQREGVPSLESIRMAAIFAGLTVHAGTEEAEETFGLVVAKYKSMHGSFPPVEHIQDILKRHLPSARAAMYETVLPWSTLVQDAMKRGLRDRELRRHIWVDLEGDQQVESIGLAKMSFAFMLMGQNLCCLDTWCLAAMYADRPFDPENPQEAAIRRRAVGDRISKQWPWSPAKSGRELALKRYEQVEDALVKGNPWHEEGPLDRTQTQWTGWEWALGVPAYHRPWLEVTKELQREADFPRPEVPF